MVKRLAAGTVVALALAACGGNPNEGGSGSLKEATANARAEAADDGLIDCAAGGETTIARVCTVDQIKDKDGLLLTIRHKDGGFRRLRVLKDGRGVVPADGAEPAAITPMGPRAIEVKIGADRYILPATVKGAGKSADGATGPK